MSRFRSSLSGKNRKNRQAKKNRIFTRRRANGLNFEALEDRRLLALTTFENGVGGYDGTQDTGIFSISPNINFGTETSISPDQQDANGVRQGLVRFDNIFGNLPGQIPLGSTINSATLELSVVNSSVTAMQMSFYRVLVPWSEATATWNTFGQIGGMQASENEVTDLPPDAILFDPTTNFKSIDVTTSLKHWSAGQANLGWMIESAATDGWDFETSEAAIGQRPTLTVNYTAPSGAGQITLLDSAPRVAEGDSGITTATITVSRLGGVTGAISANYTITAGTAAGTDFVADAGVVNFAAGQTTATIEVEINGDTVLEGNKTVVVTLSSPTGGATLGAAVATLTIADDDALINEVLANVSDNPAIPGLVTDETNREYVELIGTPGASLAGYYFVVFEGEEEEGGGTGSGRADFVVDLTGQTFGSDGLLVLTPSNWAYTEAAGTNRMIVPALDASGGGIEDSSQTYALIRSSVPIVQGTDYDTVGAYEPNPTPHFAIGTGVGILDHPIFLDGTAQMVDSVGVVEGGTDRDRVATTPELGHPGIHVHQPTGNANSENVTSDAVSRRAGNRLPNSIGAWYNGDIFDTNVDNTPLNYLNGTTRISVVAPQGAVLTPGALNTLRNVQVTADITSVDEATGQATFTVTRTGDLSQEIDVAYTTQDGTARVVDNDYVANSGVLHFGVGVATMPITVTITDDGVAEGFENFSVRLTAVDAPFLIVGGPAVVTINDADVLAAEFQQGPNYSGTLDTYIDASDPLFFFSFSESMTIDNAAGEATSVGADIRPQQGLIRFDNLFGNALGQVPQGAQIFGGFLEVKVISVAAQGPSGLPATIELYRMLQDWDDFASWTSPNGSASGSIINGVTPDGVEAAAVPDSSVPIPAQSGIVQIPLNADTLQAWANGTLPNYGWAIISNSSDSWTIATSEDASLNPFGPKLTLLYNEPSTVVGAGEFEFSLENYETLEGTTATIRVQRVGGSTGAASVNYSVTPGTGTLGDLTGSLSGTLNFAAGQLSQTFTISTVNDSAAELNETFNLTLTNPSLGSTISSALGTSIFTIRDNDTSTSNPPVLMSEVVFNQPANDGGSEFIELVGTPGTPLGSFYAVVVGGDLGDDEGATNLVVDLGSYSIGPNGTLMIGSQNNFNWHIPTGTTFVGVPELDVEFVGGNDNGTSTYALVYSPLRPLNIGRFDYDWDNDGGLELPIGAVIVDSIGYKDNSTSDATYGGSANTIITNPGESYDALTRLPGSTARNSASNWYGGDILGSNDSLVYNPEFVTPTPIVLTGAALPSTGAAATPGLINTGTNAANPRVSITSVNTDGGVVEVIFSGNINQVLAGDGSASGLIGAGISVTQLDGTPIPGVNPIPGVSGFDSNTLTLSFTGAQTVAGNLPSGNYKLNFVGNSLVGNGRAVDAANTGVTSNNSIVISIGASLADFNGDGRVNGRDFLMWQRGFGTPAPTAVKSDGDADNDTDVDVDDLVLWQDQYGTGSLVATSVAFDSETSEASEGGSASFVENTWIVLPAGLIAAIPTSVVQEYVVDEVFADEPVSDAFIALDDEASADWSWSMEDSEDDLLDEAFSNWELIGNLV